MSCFDRVQFGGYVYGVFCAIRQCFSPRECTRRADDTGDPTSEDYSIFELEVECR